MLDGIISTGSAYNNSFCYNVSRGRLITQECDYPIFYYMEDILFRSFFGCFFHIIEILGLGALWFCNIWIQRDFTEAYMSSVVLPLSVSTIAKIAIFLWNLVFPRDFERAWLINMIYSTAVTTSQLTLIQGLPFFLFMAMKLGNSRKQNYGLCTWVPYMFTLLVSFPLSAVFNVIYKPEYAAPTIIAILALILISLIFVFIFIGMGCMMFSCCSKSKLFMDMLDPVVYDARSRLGWAMLYAFLAPLCCYPCFYCFVSLAFFVDMKNDFDVLSNEMATRVWCFFFGPSVLIFTFVILPSYRDTILCGCKYRQFTKKVNLHALGGPTGVTQPVHIPEINVTPVVSLREKTTESSSGSPVFVITSASKKSYPTQFVPS